MLDKLYKMLAPLVEPIYDVDLFSDGKFEYPKDIELAESANQIIIDVTRQITEKTFLEGNSLEIIKYLSDFTLFENNESVIQNKFLIAGGRYSFTYGSRGINPEILKRRQIYIQRIYHPNKENLPLITYPQFTDEYRIVRSPLLITQYLQEESFEEGSNTPIPKHTISYHLNLSSAVLRHYHMHQSLESPDLLNILYALRFAGEKLVISCESL